MTRHKKIGGVKKSISPITREDEIRAKLSEIRAKLLARCAVIQREVLAAAMPDNEPFDEEPPDAIQ